MPLSTKDESKYTARKLLSTALQCEADLTTSLPPYDKAMHLNLGDDEKKKIRKTLLAMGITSAGNMIKCEAFTISKAKHKAVKKFTTVKLSVQASISSLIWQDHIPWHHRSHVKGSSSS